MRRPSGGLGACLCGGLTVQSGSILETGPAATTGQGLENLQACLESALTNRGGREDSGAVYLTARQEAGVRSARDALGMAVEESVDLDETINRAELLAFNLREALDSLAAVSGTVTTEDLLSTVFSSFCIGK